MIKHGLIVDKEYFLFLEEHVQEVLALEPAVLEQVIYQSGCIKSRTVSEDEREHGKRHLLNLGHTIGHALEQITQYAISHGEAVAIGLLAEGHISMQLGHLHPEALKRIRKILEDYGLPLQLPGSVSVESMLQVMALDKKSRKGQPRFVILNDIGESLDFQGQYCVGVEERIIKNALQWMIDDLCRH